MSELFISHSSRDNDLAKALEQRLGQRDYHSLFLDFDPDQGIPSGKSWERTLYRKLRACHAVVAILSDAYLKSHWCFAEIALARMERKPIFALMTNRLSGDAKLPAVLEEQQYIDARSDEEGAYRMLWRGLAEAGITEGIARRWSGNEPPYPGLHYFREGDEALFFGREAETKQGLDLLNSGRSSGLLMILGVSGSGKSSLVRAGMVPRLRRDPDRWQVVGPFRPGPSPTRELCARLGRAFQTDYPMIEESLALHGLAAEVHELRYKSGRLDAHVLLVIDQFEELLGNDAPDDANSFLGLLRAAIEERNSPVVVLATMRSDFLGAFQQCDAVKGIGFDLLSLGPLSAGSMRRLIEGPADLAGVELEVQSDGTSLVERLVDDALDPGSSTAAPSVLPLLAFTLRELWDRYHHDGMLEIREYEELGGLKGAVAKKADAVLKQVLASWKEEEARDAFRLMARLTEEGKYVRGAPVRLDGASGEPNGLLRPFRDARLVVELGDGTVEVAHEVIFESWGTLKGWLDEDKEGLLVQEQVARAAAQWEEAEPKLRPDYLWKGGRLERVQELRDNGRLRVDELGARFLRRSEEKEHEALEREQARQLELERALRRSKAGYLAQSAALIGSDDPVLSLLLARAAVETEENPETLAQLYDSLRLPWVAFTYPVANPQIVSSSPAGDRVAIAARESLQIWSRGGDLIASSDMSASELVWSPDGRLLFAGIRSGLPIVLDADGRELYRFELPLSSVRWSPRGDCVSGFAPLPSGSALDRPFDDRTLLCDLHGRAVAELRGDDAAVKFVRWRPDGMELLTGSDDGRVVIWSRGGVQHSVLEHEHRVHDAEWSPNGELIVTVAGETGGTKASGASIPSRGELRMWDAQGNFLTKRVHGAGALSTVAWSPDGSRFATAAQDEKILLWTVGAELAATLHHGYWTTRLSWSTDGTERLLTHDLLNARIWSKSGTPTLSLPLAGRTSPRISCSWFPGRGEVLMVGDAEGARVWDCDGGFVATFPHEEPVSSADWSPDRRLIITTSNDRTARLWSAGGDPLSTLVHEAPVTHGAWSPDGNKVATAAEDGTVTLWSQEGERSMVLSGHRKSVTRVAWSPDGSRIASASSGSGAASADGRYVGEVLLWDAQGAKLASLHGDGAGIESIAWDPSGELLATIDVDRGKTDSAGRGYLWGSDGELCAELVGHRSGGWGCRWSPTGEHLATASYDNTARIWDRKGRQILVLPHDHVVLECSWSPTGDRIVTLAQTKGAESRELRSYNLHGALERRVEYPEMTSVSWSPCGRYILTTQSDGSARIRAPDLSLLAQARPHSAPARMAGWSEENGLVLTHSEDRTASIWPGTPDGVNELAESRETRSLTDEERRRYRLDDGGHSL